MNTFALLTLVAFILYLQAGAWALIVNRTRKVNQIFALLCILLSLYAAGNHLLITNAYIEQVYIYDRIAAIGWILFPLVTVWFFIEFSKIKNSIVSSAFLFFQAPVALYGLINVLLRLEEIKFFYKYEEVWFYTPNSELVLFYIFIAYLISCVVSVIYIIIRLNNTSRLNIHRIQARILLVSTIVFTILTFITGIIFPWMGITLTPGLASFAPLSMVIGILYSLLIMQGKNFDSDLIYKLIQNHIREFLFFLDHQGRIYAANNYTLNTLKYNNYDLTWRGSSSFFSSYEKVVELLQNMDNRTISPPVKIDLITRDSKRIPVLLTIIKIIGKYECTQGYVLTCIDYRQKLKLKEEIKERVNTENQLNKIRMNLEMMVEKQTSELQEANQKLHHEVLEKKRAEQQIMADLHEKIVLVQEIHHRVKNNIQIIISLIHMLSNHPKIDQYASERLKHIDEKVRFISSIHEDFYSSPNLSSIAFADYLKKTIGLLCSIYGRDHDVIFKLNIAKDCLNINQAIPLGIIFNEFLQNVFMHAFQKGENGEKRKIVRIEFVRNQKHFTLLVSDNGVGLPENLDEIKRKKIGLQIVEIIAREHLKGEIFSNGVHGATYKVSFDEQTI